MMGEGKGSPLRCRVGASECERGSYFPRDPVLSSDATAGDRHLLSKAQQRLQLLFCSLEDVIIECFGGNVCAA